MASHLVRLGQEPDRPLDDDQQRTAVGDLRIAWREWRPATASSDAPVVLLHGSPGSSNDFATLGPALAERYRALAPDLPGFGASSRKAPSYSIAFHAQAVLDWLDALDIDQFHLLGFSMGGGVAWELTALAPDRVLSLAQVSAIGAQEMELLGDATLNRHLHELQLAFLLGLRELTPHFGRLDRTFLSYEYARNFYDTDHQRLNAVMEQWSGPTLILQGIHDPLVPYDAALRNHEIVEHSRLVTLDRSHFFVFGEGEMAAGHYFDFRDGTLPPQDEVRAATERFLGTSAQIMLSAGVGVLHHGIGAIRLGSRVRAGALSLWAAALGLFLGTWLPGLLVFRLGRRCTRAPRPASPFWFWLPALLALPYLWLPGAFGLGVRGIAFSRYAKTSALICALWSVSGPLLGSL